MRADSVIASLTGQPTSEVGGRMSGRDTSVDVAGAGSFAALLGRAGQDTSETPATSRQGGTAGRDQSGGVTDQDARELPDTESVDFGPGLNPGVRDTQAGSPGKEQGPQVLPGTDPVVAKDGNGPEILPGPPGKVTGTEDGPQTLPGPAPVAKEGEGPEILPGEDVLAGKDEQGPPVLPGPPAPLKDGQGPQILPGTQTSVTAGETGGMPLINPGPPPSTEGAEANAQAEAKTADPAQPQTQAQAQAQAGTPSDRLAQSPLAPAMAQRLSGTRNPDGNAAQAPDEARLTGRFKARLNNDASAPALQAATDTPAAAPTAPLQTSLNQTLQALAGMTAQASPEAQLKGNGAGDAPATPPLPLTDPAAPDALRAAMGAGDRNLGLSTLSRATVETTALIAAQMQNRLQGRSTRFEMALTPEGLGRVDVSLEIDSDGRLAARLAFDNPAAATELRARADELRRQLEQAGLHLDSDALQFTERDPSSRGDGFDGFRGFDRKAFSRASDINDQADGSVTAPAVWQPLTLTRDRVDLKV